VSHGMSGHVVVVGYGRVGKHIIAVLERLGVPRLVVEQDAARASEFQQRGIPTLFGDASNSEILSHADLKQARALVVTVPDETATELIVIAAHQQAPELPIIVRAATSAGVRRLLNHGARDVIHPELEGGLEIVRHTLLALKYPLLQVEQYIDAVRHDAYDTAISSHEEHLMFDQLMSALRSMALAWHEVPEDSPLVGRTLAAANLRALTGASVIAIVRGQRVIANPKSSTVFTTGDQIGLIGEAEQVAAAAELIAPGRLSVPGRLELGVST
jgi:CPA2 family monovalent cation:H+ antiporter-2